ncbi:MAG: metallophosphoesterase [Candidatus Bathyarchaeia archaeon]
MKPSLKLIPLIPFPVLGIEKNNEKVLVAGDFHIGWEIALAQQGIHIPSQTSKLIEKMIEVIESYKPTSIILIGDIKHTVGRIELEEWKDIPEFFEKISSLVKDIKVIIGNHDGNLEPLTPNNVKIFSSKGLILWNEVGLIHGNAWPKPEMLGCDLIIMGHLHPVVVFLDRTGFRITKQVWVKVKINGEKLAKALLEYLKIKTNEVCKFYKEKFNLELKNPELIIMPSFNEFLGGQPLNQKSFVHEEKEEYIGPILRSNAIEISKAELYLLDGTFLGELKYFMEALR